MRPARCCRPGGCGRRRQVAVVGDERAAVGDQRLLDYRMAAAGNGESKTAVDIRPRVIAFDRQRRQRRRDVKQRHRVGRFLDRRAGGGDRRGEAIEDVQFQRQRAVGGIGDLGFEFAKLGGGEADLAGRGLAMDERGIERRRHQFIAVLRRDVDEIAEHIVMPDFQRPDAGGLGVAHLQRGDDAARFVAQCPRFVERRLVAGADKTAVAAERRQLLGQRPLQLGSDRGVGPAQRRDGLRKLARQRAERRKPRGKFTRRENAVADRRKVARAATADDDARQRAGQIGHCFEPAAQIVTRDAVVDEGRHRSRADARSRRYR